MLSLSFRIKRRALIKQRSVIWSGLPLLGPIWSDQGSFFPRVGTIFAGGRYSSYGQDSKIELREKEKRLKDKPNSFKKSNPHCRVPAKLLLAQQERRITLLVFVCLFTGGTSGSPGTHGASSISPRDSQFSWLSIRNN